MEVAPDTLPWQSVYKIMIGAIVPRPIGWISSVDRSGVANLAPFSFFNALCANPPHVMFSPMIRGTDRREKDTLRNVRDTGEFVVNIVTAALAEAMNLSSTELPPEVDEFAVANLLSAPSVRVRPPRVAASPIHFECEVAHIIELGSAPGGSSVVIGRIVYLHVSDEVLVGGDKIDLASLQPIGRLAGASYCRVTDIFDMIRPASKVTA